MTLAWLLLTTLAAPVLAPAEPTPIACQLPKGVWNTGPEDVSAIRCGGVDGFFVPTAVYRSFRRPQDSEVYRLLDKELEISKAEALELRSAETATKRIADANLEVARIWEDGWKAAQASLEKDAAKLAADREAFDDRRLNRPFWEHGTFWFGVGMLAGAAAVIGGAYGLKQAGEL